MNKSSKYWDKRALNRLNEAEKLSDTYIKRIQKMYEQAYKNIDDELESIYRNYSNETGIDTQKLKEKLTKSQTSIFWKTLNKLGLTKYVKNNYKSRISRLEQIQAQIYAKAKEIYSKEEKEQRMCYKGVINHSYNKAIYDTQIGTGYDFAFNKIDDNLIKALLDEKWSGKNYSQRIWGNTDILANSVSEIIGGGLLSGQSIQKTARQIKDRFNVGKYYSERLVRTETNHFNNKVDAIAYEEMGIDEYVFVATLDNRTSEICQSLDNKRFKYKDMQEGVNYPPMHPNCRSKTRGYLGEEAERNLKRRARNPITGQNEVIDNISYKEWSKKYGLGANDSNNTLEKHPKPKYLGNIKNSKETDKVLKNYEKIIKNDTIENAIVITKRGEVYQCFGNANNVWIDIDLKENLNGAIVTHNHPKDETYFGFSEQDINLFEKFNLKKLRGVDYKFTYELNGNKKPVLKSPNFEDDDLGLEHIKSIDYAIKNNIYYMRWKNDKK